ncbi:uncharacterized protein BDZ99DRAFT_462981 [Mytilinidion resinicola]|uniref:Cytochrome c oxidase-assembly factor COX23, mitochondrial n=1 Tax=Mytilinidion resinicola TaxID=574789 RepID=A0A6A6YNE1_9PEZI|nr:uncharacterized protein BDZ99DRAFT_462981 [Mytilinidion resinicola]KAF2810406.1 hypothetical protein BDZ99DRAFT_462981 [Mytilinidion resinicola]
MPSQDDPETPWTEAAASRYENKPFSQYFDPCEEAAQRSLRCLYRNEGDREMCTDFFQAYRDCKKQWMKDKAAARKKDGKWF